MSDFINNKMNYLIRLITREMEIDWDIHCVHSEYPMYSIIIEKKIKLSERLDVNIVIM